ncbi:MAG: ATP-dependent DNA helicase RecG [Athalassotoga sp.]
MLFEDFVYLSEEYIQKTLNGDYKPDDFEKFVRTAFKDTLVTSDSRERFVAFCEYFLGLSNLSRERVITRLKNGLAMIEKLKRENLIESPMPDGEVLNPDVDVRFGKKIGPRRAETLQRLGIYTIRDLLYHFPRIHDDRRRPLKILELKAGQQVSATAQVVSVEKKQVKNFKIINMIVTDGFSNMYLVWFNQEYLYDSLSKAKRIAFSGNVKSEYGKFKVYSPDFQIIDDEPPRIYPIYDLTSGISQGVMRSLIENNIKYVNYIKDPVPEELIKLRNLIDLKSAIYGMHFPKSEYHLKESKKRLAYDEFFYLEVSKLMVKHSIQSRGGVAKEFKGDLAKKFISLLPFKLTNAQKNAILEIENDLKSDKMMNRLLHGDVGSGKTVVAEISILDVIESGFQAAFMAPTYVLARQHYERIRKDFENLDVKIAFISGSTPNAEKTAIKDGIASGDIDLVIGTHALIQKDVFFKNLGLVVIDEQHKFGVRQRESLMSKGKAVDTLVMTATPIPRTLSMTLYGDLDITLIDEMPYGRKNPRTFIVNESKRSEVYDFVKQEMDRGVGVFWIVPLIEESEKLELSAATKIYTEFREGPFKGYEVGLLHGRMPSEEKADVMERFLNKSVQLLVSTTVIEVGIDIPHAGVMVIDHPERFGLAQLHQLRGRVGRSGNESFCLLLTGGAEIDRLRYFEHTFNGFELAEYDLKMRGPGEFMGTRQHGMPEFKVANLIEDEEILIMARHDAQKILENDPELKDHPSLLEEINRKYGERIKFVEVG